MSPNYKKYYVKTSLQLKLVVLPIKTKQRRNLTIIYHNFDLLQQQTVSYIC